MTTQAGKASGLIFAPPTSVLGHQVAELVKNCPPLDSNSTYCNLLQCHHFADTSCAVFDLNDHLVGFVSGYQIPNDPNTLFIWQVAVHPSQRGKNLGARMILDILSRNTLSHIEFLETSVTPDNAASTRMFEKLTESLSCELNKTLLFDSELHFNGQHDSELLFRIGPFSYQA